MSALAWLAPTRLTGVAAPMAVWALHFVAVYSVVGVGCEAGWQQGRTLGLSGLVWALLAVTVVCLALIVALGLRAWPAWRAAETRADPRQRRVRFLAGASGALSAIAAIAVLFTALPILFLPPCQ